VYVYITPAQRIDPQHLRQHDCMPQGGTQCLDPSACRTLSSAACSLYRQPWPNLSSHLSDMPHTHMSHSCTHCHGGIMTCTSCSWLSLDSKLQTQPSRCMCKPQVQNLHANLAKFRPGAGTCASQEFKPRRQSTSPTQPSLTHVPCPLCVLCAAARVSQGQSGGPQDCAGTEPLVDDFMSRK
jgi:hypothetical protein